jgi:hypothetical protein
MIKKLLVVALGASLFFPPNYAQAASIEGSACKQVGKVISSAKIKYECSKSKVWKILKPKADASKLASTPKVVLQKIVPASIPTMPPMPAANSFKYIGPKWPADKTEYSVALFGEPGVIMERSLRTLPIALQKLADVTGNTFNILDTSNVSIPPVNKKNCGDSYSDIDVILVGVSKWGKQLPDRKGDYHGVASVNRKNNVITCPYIMINTEASDWVQEDFASKGKSVGHTILHEFGHAFGLDHPEACNQVMQTCKISINDYAEGDRYGLYQLTQGQR